ncbi:hypothetical protein NVP1077O_57 [Vibrio phage 1.077.O._10N.261.45.A10]|nr:hypothetical protein NVP1077O_57 [Vibrio phage 1.077.O._10N.261.45.A10]
MDKSLSYRDQFTPWLPNYYIGKGGVPHYPIVSTALSSNDKEVVKFITATLRILSRGESL